MAKTIYQNLFDLKHQETPFVLTATTNGKIRYNSAGPATLVMGAGAAEQLERWVYGRERQNLPYLAAEAIRSAGVQEDGYWKYGFVVVQIGDQSVGLLQTKMEPSQPSSLKLIEYSLAKLCEWLAWNKNFHIRMNYPGIAFGRLNEYDVAPMLADLPDSITICKRG